MSKYPIREEDNHFYEDDYHDMHGVEPGAIATFVVMSVVLGLIVLYVIVRMGNL